MYKVYITLGIFICFLLENSTAIWCYRCTSATPGCADKFNWRGIGYLGEQCPEDKDICVKVTERHGAKELITRDCLSALSFRSDIPADKYEGCRKSAVDNRLAHYVNHTIKEHDVKRTFYEDVTFCFCFLDHRCNSANSMQFTTLLSSTIIALSALILSKLF